MQSHVPRSFALHSACGERKYLDHAECQRFLAACASFDPTKRGLCQTLHYTGCRISEALSLTPAAFDFTSRCVVIESKKKRTAGHMRVVPVPDCYLSLMQELVAARSLYRRIFCLSRTQAWRTVKYAMLKAHISGQQACPKGLRHSFGVHAIRSGVPLNMLQKWMGHTHMETTAIYANAMGQEERAIAMKMW